MGDALQESIQEQLQKGLVIPAHPLALDGRRKLDERRQRALSRYYLAAGAGGLAVGVHTTQFAIRQPSVGLHEPVLQLAAEEMDRADSQRKTPVVRMGGICGDTTQALGEATTLRALGYHGGLLSLAALAASDDDELIAHCKAVGEIIPIIGFYLQPAVGGRVLGYEFWRRFAELESVVAIKIAPFNRYQTLDVIRAVAESGRDDLALYTGNDDNIVLDLLTPYTFRCSDGREVTRRMVGGLLGHWAVWTKGAVALLDACHSAVITGAGADDNFLRLAQAVTDSNGAFFDAANGFKGCIAGLHEVLRRQGILEHVHCLDPREGLSGGQLEEIDRVYAAYPHLNDDAFVAEHLNSWLG